MTKGYSGMEKLSESSCVLASQVSSLIPLTIKHSSRVLQYLRRKC